MRRTSSTSKIINNTAKIKNRREKGTREDLIGLKPHSNGLEESTWGSKYNQLTI